MSLVMYRQYRGMIERGTCDLAMIDAAEKKRFVTAQEAADLRAYWQVLYGEPAAAEGDAATTEPAGTAGS